MSTPPAHCVNFCISPARIDIPGKGTLSFGTNMGSTCNDTSSADLSLQDYNLFFTDTDINTVSISISTDPPSNVTLALKYVNGDYTIVRITSAVTNILVSSAADGKSATISYERAKWTIYINQISSEPIVQVFNATLCVSAQASIDIEGMPSTRNCPTINGSASTTMDGQQLAQAIITVFIPSAICPDCPCRKSKCNQEVSVKTTYYFIDLAAVLQGPGCTFQAKLTNLGLPLTTTVNYSILRLVLSKILFNDDSINLNVEYLEQSYYKEFLRKLRKSEFCRFIAIFKSPLYRGYYKYFIC